MLSDVIHYLTESNFEECANVLQTTNEHPTILFIQCLQHTTTTSQFDFLLQSGIIDWTTQYVQGIICYTLSSLVKLELLRYAIETKKLTYDINVAIYACKYKQVECLDYYFQLGNDPSSTILTEAIREDSLELIECCLKWGCEPPQFTITMECFHQQQFDVLSYFSKIGLPWFTKDEYPHIFEEIERHTSTPKELFIHPIEYRTFLQDCKELVEFYDVVNLSEYTSLINASSDILSIDVDTIQLFLEKERELIYNSEDCVEDCILLSREICPLFMLYIEECYVSTQVTNPIENYVRLELIRRTCLYMMEQLPSIYPVSRMVREIDTLSEHAEQAFDKIESVYYLLTAFEERGLPKEIIRERLIHYLE